MKKDKCQCGGPKGGRSKVCKRCQMGVTNLPRDQWDKRYQRDFCKCGTIKTRAAEMCVACRKQTTSKQQCVCPTCGGRKEPRSKTCLQCHYCAISPIDAAGLITCTKCKKPLSTDHYYKKRKSGGIMRSMCIMCCREDGRRRNIITKCLRFGIEMHTAVEIARFTEIRCAICGDITAKFHIDHDHATKQFRGLLCANCNSGLGLFRDNPERLLLAAEYLQTPSTIPITSRMANGHWYFDGNTGKRAWEQYDEPRECHRITYNTEGGLFTRAAHVHPIKHENATETACDSVTL